MDFEIIRRYQSAGHEAGQWLLEKLKDDGSLASSIFDLSGYYLLPYLFSQLGYIEESQRVICFIQKTFMDDKGDFVSKDQFKTEDVFLSSFPCIPNGWITLAAQKMGIFDVSYPALQYLRNFYNQDNGSFCTKDFYTEEGSSTSDVLTTAQLGLLALYCGDLNKAQRAGNFLTSFLSMQPDIHHAFYLHATPDGKPVTSFDNEVASLYVLMKDKEKQKHGILGLTIVFLCKLYDATQDEGFLSSAKSYMSFLHDMHPGTFEDEVSGYVAWGAASLALITQDEALVDLSIQATEQLLTRGSTLKNDIDSQSYRDCKKIAEFGICVNQVQSLLCRI